jgi:hypothetical protein
MEQDATNAYMDSDSGLNHIEREWKSPRFFNYVGLLVGIIMALLFPCSFFWRFYASE